MSACKASIAALALVATGVHSQPATTPTPRDIPVLEAYPLHIQARLDRQRAEAAPARLGTELQGVFEQLKLWTPAQSVRVCFFGGPADLRQRIAAAAQNWMALGKANLVLDFGNPQSPRSCIPGEYNHIRIGYEYSGYWSLLGLDSINLALQGEQSMNFQRFDLTPATEPEFTTVVMHEFGHALGLHHEHQHPYSKCEQEFDWPKIETYLAGPPNYWSKEKIAFNLRQLQDDRVSTTPFDVRSIMLYHFPDWMYKPDAKECRTVGNVAISDGDKKTIQQLYPGDPDAGNKKRDESFSRYKQLMSADAPNAPDPARRQELMSSETRQQLLERASIIR